MSADARPAPLAGLRVVAVEQFGAGPFGTLYLSDLGAEVIKVEDPATGGDVARFVPPSQHGDSHYFETFNRGKASIALDLKNDAGREVFERLVTTADAIFSNLRGDQAKRLRLTYRDVAHVNPRIVCVALTGYGSTGADADLPGYDALVQAEAGWAAMTGEPHGPPTKSGLSLADYIAGLTAALGLLAGVMDARRVGLGRDIDTNLYDSALAMLSYPATWYLSLGLRSTRQPLSAHPTITPFQFFRTADGYIALACPKEKFFQLLVAALGEEKLASDARFATFDARLANRDALLATLSERIASAGSDEWLRRLREVVPIAPVRTMEQALEVEELEQRGMLAEYEHPRLGPVRSVGLPMFIDGFKPDYRPGPALGADTHDVLRELGYTDAEVATLKTRGAFGGRALAASR
jgi:crotonobetainyl-CoA:carnitine CoA-transferase CaiB-like acyl-CoA transferase